jgi:hypothetical protein
MSQQAQKSLAEQLVEAFNDPDPDATARFGDLLNAGYDAILSQIEWDEIDQQLRSQPGWNVSAWSKGGMTRMILFYAIEEKPYGCFSNLSPHPVSLDGETWPTVEHFFQAQKFAG